MNHTIMMEVEARAFNFLIGAKPVQVTIPYKVRVSSPSITHLRLSKPTHHLPLTITRYMISDTSPQIITHTPHQKTMPLHTSTHNMRAGS